MWSCVFNGWFFLQNGCRCHGNRQNAKKMKNTKMIIASYSLNWWNFAAVAMETKKGGFKKILDSFPQTSWNFVGISTAVCGSFWAVEKMKNGGRSHGIQGAKNVKFTPNVTHICSNVSCHIHIWWNEISQKKFEIGKANFAAVAMEKGGLNKFLDSFHQTSWNFVGLSIVVCGSFLGGGVEKISKWWPLQW